MRNRYTSGGIAMLILLSLLGCNNDNQAKQELNEGYSSLDARQYDQAISQADAFLQHTPAGPGSAEALYLKGRALEQKPASSVSESRSNLQSAREAYIDALQKNPSPQLDAYIYTSMANVAYSQDDYAVAATEWTIAYGKLNDPSIQPWVMYRIGLCRQRLGAFADADEVFTMVQENYPNTPAAQRALEHQGVRGFSVQMATFATGSTADNAILTLRSQGVLANKKLDSRGRSIVMVGPLPSYQQAQSVKLRYASTYPNAIILP
jgi:TolA-binding protein